MSELQNKTFSGITWSVAANVIRQILNIIFLMILARLLSPREFGLMAMLTIIINLANLFMEMGFSEAIVQKKDIDDRHLSSVFWLNVASGLALMWAGVSASFYVAKYFNEPTLQLVMSLISVNFFIDSLNVVQKSLLIKNVEFKRLALIEFFSVSGAGAGGVILALNGFGIWSLAWQSVFLTSLTVILMWITSPWRPRLSFHLSAIKDLISFSGYLFGFKLLGYFVSHIDNLLVGRYIGSYALGFYDKAYQFMLLPVSQITQIISRVMFPALSSINEDKQRVKRIYLQTLSFIALITFPLLIGLFVVAKYFVAVVLGAGWEPVTPILQVFCIVGLTHSVGSTTGWIYLSQSRTDLMFKWGLFAAIVKFIGIVAGLRWGVLGVAVGYTSVTILFLMYPGYRIAGALINMKFREVLGSVIGILNSALVMAITVFLLDKYLPLPDHHLFRLVVLTSLGTAVYYSIIHYFKLKPYLEFKRIVKEQINLRFSD